MNEVLHSLNSPTRVDAVPADSRSIVAAAVRQILIAAGEDPEREGLRDTPLRVAKMYEEIFSGLAEDPRDHLATQFSDDQHEDMVIVKDISFYSVCEHHLVPFFGKAHVAYIPQGGQFAMLRRSYPVRLAISL